MAVDSQLVTVSASGTTVTATTKAASVADVLTSVISTDSAITGTMGLAQRIGLFVGGMSVQSKLKTGSWNPFA